MTTWTETDPGAGDTGSIRVQAARFDAHVATVTSVRELAQLGVTQTGGGSWTGAAADAWRSGADDLLSQLQQLAQQLLDLATALHVHAGQVDDIAARALPHRNTLTDTERIAEMMGPSGSLLLHPPRPDAADRLRVRQLERDEAAGRRRTAQDALRALAAERLASDQRAALALQPVQVADWAVVAAVLAGAGIASPRQVSTEAVVGAWASWTERALADGRLSGGEVAHLTRFFDDFAGEGTAMSRYFRQLGGAATATLVDALGNGVHAGRLDSGPALALAVAVQQGLSVGTRDWGAEQARRFARSLAAGPFGAGVVGFLFGDVHEAPMGRELAVAMADLVDARERLGGEAWTIPAASAGGGLALANLQFPDRAGRAADPVGVVLQTLGQHPDAALVWLTDVPAGTGRVAYWFGRRDWPAIEGCEGPAALWAGVQRATGGPGDPQAFDRAVWEALAQLNVDIAVALEGNGSFSATSVSDAAADELALVVAANLPLWLEVPIVSRAGADGRNGLEQVPFGWLGATLPVPALDMRLVHDLVGIAGRTDVGRGRIHVAVVATADRLMAAVDAGTYPLGDALKRVALLHGVAEGAVATTAMVVAAHHDAHVRTAIDVLSVGLSRIPVPRTAAGVDDALEVFAEGLTHLGVTQAEHRWADGYGTAVDAYWADADDREVRIRDLLTAAAAGRTTLTGDALPQYVGEFVADYDDARGNAVAGAQRGGA